MTRTDIQYVAQSGFWNNLGVVSVSVFSFLLYLLFARYLSPETYGTYQYLLSLAVLVSSLTLTGLNTSVAKTVAQGNDSALQQAVRLQLKWYLVPASAGICASAYYLLNGNLTLGLGLLLIGILTPLQYTFSMYSGFLLGKKDFRRGFLYGLAVNVPFYTVLAVVALTSNDPLLLLGANLIAQSLGVYVAYRSVLRVYKPKSDGPALSKRYGGHLSFMGTLGTLGNQIDSLVAFHVLGPAQLAVYSFATAIPDRLASLLKFLPAASLPRFSNRTEEEIRVGLRARIWLMIGSLSLFAVTYAFFAQAAYDFFFPQYSSAAPFSQVYAITILGVGTQVLLSALLAHERIRSLYVVNTAIPVLQILASLVGAILFGLWGLVVGRVIITFTSFGLLALLVLRSRPTRTTN